MRNDYHILGYADDIVIFEENPEQLQFAIDKLVQFINKSGLEINPRKCHSAHIDPIHAICKNTVFEIGGTAVPALKKFEMTEYLGKPIGFNIFSNQEKIDEFIDYGTRIMTSHLAPWQRIDALKCFFFPSLSYAMRTDQFDEGEWKRLDQALKPLIKSTLNLPDRACTDYIYWNPKDGLFDVPLVAEDSDIAKIDTAKLLMSIDPNVKIHAWEDLKTCAKMAFKILLFKTLLIFSLGSGTVTLAIGSLPSGPVPVRPLAVLGSIGSLLMTGKFQ